MMKERMELYWLRIPILIAALTSASLACNLTLPSSSEISETPTPAGGVIDDDASALGAQNEDRKTLPCPEENTLFYLGYDHTLVMDPSPLAHFEEISVPPGELYFYIDANGKVSTEGIVNELDLTTTGWIKSPDSNDCPITNYEGTYPLRVDISGSCKNGNVHLVVKGQRIDYNLYADCPSAHIDPGLGPKSAPEMDHTFKIVEEGDVYKIENPMAGPISFTYMWVLVPGEPGELPILPLVPTLDVGE
jgi:hypothetical protein